MAYDIGPRIGITGEKEFNNQIKSINNSLRECGSEMNALKAKFDGNEKSQEALIEKTKILQKQYDTQKKKSELLSSQYQKEVAKLKELAGAYQKSKEENGEASVEAGKAERAYNKQAESVSKLKVAMNETEGYMNRLNNEIRDNRTALSEMDAGLRDAVTGLSNLGEEADETKKKLQNIETKIDTGNLMQATDTISGLADAAVDAVEGSKEYMKIMGELEVSSQRLGYSNENTKETFKQLYGILGDDQTAATTTANLQAMGLSQEDLKRVTEGVIGAWAQYGDSIPIDSLAEAANETMRVGTVTGTFADALNWAGISEDEFNEKLARCSSEQERQRLMVETLNGLYGESAGKYRENNKALVESNEAQAELNDRMAEASEKILPVLTKITEGAAKLAEVFTSLPEPAQGFLIILGSILGIGAKLAPLLLSLTTVTGASGVAAGTSAIGFGALSTSLLPIAGIVLGIIAVVTTVIMVIKNWGEITDWLKEHVGPVLESIGGFFTGLGDKIGEAKDKAVEKITEMKDKAVSKFQEMKEEGEQKIQTLKDTVTNKAQEMKDNAVSKVSKMKETATQKFEDMKNTASDKLQSMRQTVDDKMESIKESFGNKIETAKSKIDDGVGKIKDVFSNLLLKLPEIQIPHIKMPHFSIDGSFSLSPPSIPKISVSWYKEGGILSGAQIFGRAGRRFLGGGEAGKEAVLPLDTFYDRLGEIFRKALRNNIPDYSGVMVGEGPVYVSVYVGEKEFNSYIVKTARNGITRTQAGNRKAKGL